MYERSNEHRAGSAMLDCYAFARDQIAAGKDTSETRALLRDAARVIGKSDADVQRELAKAKSAQQPNRARALALQATIR